MAVKDHKHRVMLTIDRDIWEEFKRNLSAHRLPKGSASYLVEKYMERINVECSFNEGGVSPQLEMFDFDQMAEIRGEKRKGR